MNTARTADLWWKNAVVYCLDVETFLDWDGDGIGDLVGLTERLDYLAGMGVTCVWLMPFMASPSRDDGYDITDHYAVDPRLGTLGDFVAFVRTAKDRGLRILLDLVVNHTSDEHPWFVASRSSRESSYRDWYVWRDEPSDEPATGVVFPDAEDSIWAYDEPTGQYYLHHFYSHQPDLNIANPAVREEIAKICGFWLALGVDGFRVDAVPFLVETGGIPGAEDLDPHGLLADLRAFISRRRGDAVLLGEVNLPPEDLVAYFGDHGDEVQLLFAFPVMQAMYLSLARQDAEPLRGALERLPWPQADECQWAHFVRNHDELTLDQLTDSQRQEVFAAFGPDPDMQLFGRGLRRRLPPMLDGDQARIRLVYSLLFSLPGTPVLFYGEEIGMGEQLAIEGRSSVRTPMQWDDGPSGGFTTAPPDQLIRPLPDPPWSPQEVNVVAQRRDDGSLLNWMERLIRRYRETPELGWGELELLDVGERSVLGHRLNWERSCVVCLHNLGASTVTVVVPVPDADVRVVVDLLGDEDPRTPEDGAVSVGLDGYGARWLKLLRGDERST